MENWNALDWSILIALLVGFINGFRKGLIMELATLLGIILGIWLAIHSSTQMEDWLRGKSAMDGPWLPYLAFLLVFIGVYILCYLGGKALSKAISLLMLGIFNRIAGGLFGILKVILFTSLIFKLIHHTSLSLISEKTEEKSAMYSMIQASTEWMFPKINDVLKDNRPDFIDQLLED